MKGFNLSRFAARTDADRPYMCGVFHDGGYKIASNGHILAAIRSDYPADLEQKVIGRDGQEIGRRYAKWRYIFPEEGEGTGEAWTVDVAKVRGLVRQVNADKKGLKRAGYVKMGDAFFAAKYMAMICDFMDAYGVNVLRVNGPGRAAFVFAPDGSRAAIMPALVQQYLREDRDGHLWCEM